MKILLIFLVVVICASYAIVRRIAKQNAKLQLENVNRFKRLSERLDFEIALLVSQGLPRELQGAVSVLFGSIKFFSTPRPQLFARTWSRLLDQAGLQLLQLMSIVELFGGAAPEGIGDPHSPYTKPDGSKPITSIMIAGDYFPVGEPAQLSFTNPLKPILAGKPRFNIIFQLNGDGTLSMYAEGAPPAPLIVVEQKIGNGAAEPQLESRAFPLYQQVHFLDKITFEGNKGAYLKANYVMDPEADGLLLVFSLQHPIAA